MGLLMRIAGIAVFGIIIAMSFIFLEDRILRPDLLCYFEFRMGRGGHIFVSFIYTLPLIAVLCYITFSQPATARPIFFSIFSLFLIILLMVFARYSSQRDRNLVSRVDFINTILTIPDGSDVYEIKRSFGEPWEEKRDRLYYVWRGYDRFRRYSASGEQVTAVIALDNDNKLRSISFQTSTWDAMQ